MQTNMNQLWMSGSFPIFASPTASPAVVGGGENSGEGFVDLLDLVNDLQLADSQGFEQGDFVESESARILDADQKNLLAQTQWSRALLAQATSPELNSTSSFKSDLLGSQPRPELTPSELFSTMPRERGLSDLQAVGERSTDIGQPNRKSEFSEAEMSNFLERSLQGEGLRELAQRQVTQSTQTSRQMYGEAAQAWATAFVNNDVRAVEVEALPEAGPSVQRKQEAFLLDSPQHGPGKTSFVKPQGQTNLGISSLESRVAQGDASKTSESFVRETPRQIVPQASLEQKTAALPRERATVSDVRPSGREKEASVGEQNTERLFRPSKQESPKFDFGNSDRESHAFAKEDKEPLSNQGKESRPAVAGSSFLLDRVAVQSFGQGTEKMETISNVRLLGSPGDRRISATAVDFVAEKVQALKDVGGGRLRVELNPQNMGTLEIRVVMNRGQLKVDLYAENGKTLEAVKGSLPELNQKLAQIAPTELQVADFRDKAEGVRSMVNAPSGRELPRLEAASSQTASTGTLRMSSDSGWTEARPVLAGTEDRAQSGMNSKRDSSSAEWMQQRQQAFGEDRRERREKAMNDWEQFRRSA